MALTPRQERYRDNMRRHRKAAANNLKAARKLHQRGDKQGTEFLEKHGPTYEDWALRNPNPDRRAALLKWAAQLEESLNALEQGHAERRDSFTPQQWVQGEEMLKTLRDVITNTYALADAARY